MAKKLAPEDIQGIADKMMAGASPSQICAEYRTTLRTVKKIHEHLQRVGHYGAVSISGEMPALPREVRGRRPGKNTLTQSIFDVLQTAPCSLRPIEILNILRGRGIPLNHKGLLSMLSQFHARGLVRRVNHQYWVEPERERP